MRVFNADSHVVILVSVFWGPVVIVLMVMVIVVTDAVVVMFVIVTVMVAIVEAVCVGTSSFFGSVKSDS